MFKLDRLNNIQLNNTEQNDTEECFKVMLSKCSVVLNGGAEVHISGGLYKRSFVYLLVLEEVRIQYTNSYTETCL